jgi:hypothetical protein
MRDGGSQRTPLLAGAKHILKAISQAFDEDYIISNVTLLERQTSVALSRHKPRRVCFFVVLALTRS